MAFSKDIKIRHFENDDLDSVAHILVDAFYSKFNTLSLSNETLSQLFIDTGFANSKSFQGYIVAEVNNKVLGVMLLKWKNQKRTENHNTLNFFELCKKYGSINMIKFILCAALLHENSKKGECYIEYIAVSPEARGLGIGTMLLNYGREFVCKTPYLNQYTLYVASSNKSAIRLYNHLGFCIKNSESSLLTSIIFKEKKWLYMVNNLSS